MKLELIDLGWNKISTFAPKTFKNLHNLRVIYISNNEITNITNLAEVISELNIKLKLINLKRSRIFTFVPKFLIKDFFNFRIINL
jgi:Leucine-rich repeat (LRR) protein